MAKLIPMMVLNPDAELLAHADAQLIHFGNQQLAFAQLSLTMRVDQFGDAEQPELVPLRSRAALPARESESLLAEPRDFKPEQSTPLLCCEHQGTRVWSKAEGYQ